MSEETRKTPKILPEELEALDILDGEKARGSGLSATLDAFSTRIQRKKKEQEALDSSAERAARERQQHLLEAMVQVRRALREVSRLDLGDHFRFSLICDDVQGWPRVLLKLHEFEKPNAEHPFFEVVPYDRNSRAVLNIVFGVDRKEEQTILSSKEDIRRLSMMLKRYIRTFLDETADIVVRAKSASEPMVEGDALPTQAVQAEETRKDLLCEGEDFLDSDQFGKDIFEKLPTLDEVDALSLDAVGGDERNPSTTKPS